MTQVEQINTEVLVVGAGPAGLSAATQLRKLGVKKVLVLDRESQPGGIPRHCYHTGFGWFDLRRILNGPSYARKLVRLAERAGVEIASETTALHWTAPLSLQVTSPGGVKNISAQAILLATGCRERPRAARFIPGSRPRGVLNTGSLQQLVYLKNMQAGKKAVVVGAEHVSFSAVHSLASNGTKVIAMITDYPRHQTYFPFYWGIRALYYMPLFYNCEVTDIQGKDRVEAIEITSTKTGEKEVLECDTVVFTGDWIPDHELARKGEIVLNKNTKGPEIDQSLRTSRRAVFAAGNLLHGVEMADTASLEGRHTAHSIVRYLSQGDWPENSRFPIVVDPPLTWISPNTLILGKDVALPLGHFTFRTGKFLGKTRVEVRQDGKRLYSQYFRRLIPNQWFHLKGHWISQLRPDQKHKEIRIHSN